MKTKIRLSFMTLLTFSSLSMAADKLPAEQAPTWNENMKSLSKILTDITPDLVSESRFSDPKNFERIEANLKNLSEIASRLDLKKKVALLSSIPDADPALNWIADVFQQDVQSAYEEFKRHNINYSRSVLTSVAHVCISCHTRGSFGPAFEDFDKKTNISNLNAYEKANLYGATRRFDLAIKEYKKVISDASYAKKNTFEWQKAIREALLISVRAQKDPKASMEIVNDVLRNKNLVSFVKEDANVWKESIEEWQKESVQSKEQRKLLELGRALFQRAQARQKYPLDRAAEVDYMRMTALLHDFLRENVVPSEAADALFMLGVAYEALRDVGSWNLHERFFEDCVRKSPGTKVAKNCLTRYEEAVSFSYSGSRGLELPPEIAKKLTELKKLSEKKR